MKVKNLLLKYGEPTLVFGITFVYGLAACLVSLNRYWQFNSFWYDQGILDETIWNLSRFRLPIIPSLRPPLGANNWGDHFNPGASFLAPFYWFTDKQEIILIAQVLFVCLSALVFYLLARKKIQNGLVRTALIVSYLGFVGMQNALITDIHSIVFALLPLSLTFYAIFFQKWKLYWLFFFITLSFQESLATVGVGIGLYLILRQQRNIKVGIATMIFSVAYGLFTTRFLIPAIGGHDYYYQPQYPKNLSYWILGFVDPANLKLRTIFLSFASFGFLPLLSFSIWPLIIEHFLERFVLNTAATRWDLGLHYNALLALLLLVGNLEILAWMQTKKIFARFLPYWAAMTIAIVVVFHRFILHGPLLLATNPIFYQQTRNAEFLTDFINHVPQDGLVMTQNNIAPHLTHRAVTIMDKNFLGSGAKYIAVDLRPGQNPNNFYLLNPGEFAYTVASVSADWHFRVYYQSSDRTIFEKIK